MQQASLLAWTQAPASFLVKAQNNQSNNPNVAQIWLYQAFHGVENSIEQIDNLVAADYQQVGTEWLWFLSSQLHDTISVMSHLTQRGDLWTSRKSIDYVRRYPVILGSEMEFPDAVLNGLMQFAHIPTIPMFNPFPLPQSGQVGYILDPDKPELPPAGAYRIMDLPLEARQRWAHLGDLIRDLSSPLDTWPPYSSFHHEAKEDGTYFNTLASLQRDLERATKQSAKKDLSSQIAELMQARQQIEQLQKVWEKPDRAERWAEIQRQAQALVRDYYEFHKSRRATALGITYTIGPAQPEQAEQDEPGEQVETGDQVEQAATGELGEQERAAVSQALFPFAEQIPVTPAPAKKKGRRPAQAKQRAVASRRPYVHTRADMVGFEIGRALQSRDNFTSYPQAKIARYIQNFAKDRGEILIDIGDGTEAWSTINDALNTLDDGVTDTYYAVTALAIDRNGIQHVCEQFLISPDDILEICCKEKSNGSYTPGQRAEVVKNLKTLSLCKVRAKILRPASSRNQVKKRGRPRRGEVRTNEDTYIKIEGNLIDLLSFKIGEYSTITGEELWVKQSIAIGPWAKTVPGLSTSTAIMLREVLRYSGKNERYQKRIGIYLTHMFRYNAKHGGQFPNGISIGALLEGAGIVLTKDARKHPGNFKESIERALAVLQRDRVIGKYWEIVDATPAGKGIDQEIRERAYGWFDLWLEKKLNFLPPDEVREHYQKLLREGNEAPAGVIVDGVKHPE